MRRRVVATPLVAMRLPRELVRGLRREAHRESLKRDCEVSWVSVLKTAAEQYLRERQGQGTASSGKQ
jgi:hypothetical protein